MAESLRVFGAGGGEVTGSASILKTKSGGQFLTDFGMVQGKSAEEQEVNKKLEFDPRSINGVFITHGHLDHLGRLPQLVEVNASIYMTPPTAEISRIALRNASALSPGLYEPGSIEKVLGKIVEVSYDEPFQVGETWVTYRDAGHILGSASIEYRENNGDTIVFSGDLGNSPSRIVRPTTPIKEADIVVMEATYGKENHPDEDSIEKILDAVDIIKGTHGTLLIPAFTVQRTQELLYIFGQLRKAKKLGNIPVFLDSPMGIDITRIYEKYKHLLSEEVREQKDPFKFPGLYETRTGRESNDIQRHGTKIVIAGSGMMAGGRINNHAINYLPDEKTVILFVGYSAEGTPSRAIREGEKTVFINGERVDVNAQVRHASLSAHADQRQLLEWLRSIYGGQRNIRRLFLLHGDNRSRVTFAEKAAEFVDPNSIYLPNHKDEFDLNSNQRAA